MSFSKYRKKTTVVGAMQTTAEGDYGDLGTLTSTDYIMMLANGTLQTLDDTTFEDKYELTADSAALENSGDWD